METFVALGLRTGLIVKANIYQIYYSALTQQENDPGFLPLDNLANTRPDWREYWPIRNFLLSHELEPDRYYGFFSPKFKFKTGLNAAEVYQFLDSSNADVVHFSPFFDQSASHINIFEQGISNHPNIAPIINGSFQKIISNVDVNTLVMSSRTVLYCNFFAAKKAFWHRWFACCEAIFATGEHEQSDIANGLNREEEAGMAPTKTYVIERVASFILATEKQWTVKPFNPINLPMTASLVADYKDDLLILDALKSGYEMNRYPQYIEKYEAFRTGIINKIVASLKK